MLTRGLLLVQDVIVSFTLQTLHNVVKNAKIHVVETLRRHFWVVFW